MYYTYILYSDQMDRYYVGSTGDTLENRLIKHNFNHKGFTGKVNDWRIVFVENYDTVNGSRQRELQIKKWKSRKMIENLLAG